MKILLSVFVLLLVVSCSIKKPPLEDTQIVDGRSIIIPPEFDKLPTQGV